MRFQLSKNSLQVKSPGCYYPGSISSGFKYGSYSHGKYQSNQKNLDVQFSMFDRNSQQQSSFQNSLNTNTSNQIMRSNSYGNIHETSQKLLEQQAYQNSFALLNGMQQTGITQNLYPQLHAYQSQQNPLVDCNCLNSHLGGNIPINQEFYVADKNKDGIIDAYELAEAERTKNLMNQSLYVNSLNPNINYNYQYVPTSPIPGANFVQHGHSNLHQNVQTHLVQDSTLIDKNRDGRIDAYELAEAERRNNMMNQSLYTNNLIPNINPQNVNTIPIPVVNMIPHEQSNLQQSVHTQLLRNNSLLDKNRDGQIDAYELADAQRRLHNQSPVMYPNVNYNPNCPQVTERHVKVENCEEHSVKDKSSYSKISHNCSEVTIQK